MAQNGEKVRSKAKWLIGSGLGVLLLLTTATVGYAVYFDDHALPGVRVAGVSVTGQTKDELVESIKDRVADTVVHLKYEGKSTQVPLSALGVRVDAESMADAAFKPNENLSTQFNVLFEPVDVPSEFVLDAKSLAAYTSVFTEMNGEPAVDATVGLAPDGLSFVASPAKTGTGISLEKVIEAVNEAANTLTSVSVDLAADTLEPKIDDATAAETAEAANKLLNLDVSLVADGTVIHAEIPDKAHWIVFPTSDLGYAPPQFDAPKVQAWIDATAQSTNTAATDGIQNVNMAGAVVSTYVEAKPGRSANNTGVLGTEAVAALTGGNSYSGTLTYERVEGSYTQRLIADGADQLIYPAAPGEKWVDINLSNYTVTPYEGATQVMNTMLMVPGMPQMATPTGHFKVYLKYDKQTMRGTNLDGSKYESPDVPWVTYFNGSIAMHGAPWQPFFGPGNPNGSHGCVNMSVQDAQFIHSWTDIGTTVIVHY